MQYTCASLHAVDRQQAPAVGCFFGFDYIATACVQCMSTATAFTYSLIIVTSSAYGRHKRRSTSISTVIQQSAYGYGCARDRQTFTRPARHR
eukprot:scaffold330002_cov46-Prasinocladus_malaysianus.AAC.3